MNEYLIATLVVVVVLLLAALVSQAMDSWVIAVAIRTGASPEEVYEIRKAVRRRLGGGG